MDEAQETIMEKIQEMIPESPDDLLDAGHTSVPTVEGDYVQSDDSYACKVCPYRARQMSDLKVHSRSHTGEKPYACHLCDYRAGYHTDLKRHIARHTGEKPYFCHLCDYRTPLLSTYKSHMRTHTGEKPYACDICDFRATQLGNLKKHKRAHTGGVDNDLWCSGETDWPHRSIQHLPKRQEGKPFGCDFCEYRARQLAHIKVHMKIHTREQFKCDTCGFQTGRLNHLKNHMKSHLGERPFACHLCDYRSKEKGALTKHLERHSNGAGKPYGCEVCGLRTGNLSHLTLHMKFHSDAS